MKECQHCGREYDGRELSVRERRFLLRGIYCPSDDCPGRDTSWARDVFDASWDFPGGIAGVTAPFLQ